MSPFTTNVISIRWVRYGNWQTQNRNRHRLPQLFPLGFVFAHGPHLSRYPPRSTCSWNQRLLIRLSHQLKSENLLNEGDPRDYTLSGKANSTWCTEGFSVWPR